MYKKAYKNLRAAIVAEGGAFSKNGVTFHYNPDCPSDGIAILVGPEQQGVLKSNGRIEYDTCSVYRRDLTDDEQANVKRTLESFFCE